MAKEKIYLFNHSPHLRDEWDYEKNSIDPEKITYGSSKEVWWTCANKHSFRSRVYVRTKYPKMCGVCSGKVIIKGVNDLFTCSPQLESQWDYVKNSEIDLYPENLTVSSGKLAFWKCSSNHSWKTAVSHRSGGTGCPFCTNQRVLKGFNDLTTIHPYLADQLCLPDIASELLGTSSKKVTWQCNLGHEWSTRIVDRVKVDAYTGCPVCSNQKVTIGYNDLNTTHPDLAKELDDVYLSNHITSGSHKKVGWRCKSNHKWDAVVADRIRGDGCPICSNRLVLPGVNDFTTKFPHLVEECLEDVDLSTVLPSSKRKVVWMCGEGHTYRTSFLVRTLHATGCPFCSNKYVLSGYNDFKTHNPKASRELVTLDVDLSLLPRTSKKVFTWRCTIGHLYTMSLVGRSKGGSCLVCSNREILEGFNDLSTTNPELARQMDDPNYIPTMLSEFSGIKVKWKCSKGHTWRTTVASRS